MFEKKKILITGGTGSWGNELTKQLLEKDPLEIRILSRGEFAQVTMGYNFSDDRIKFVIGDIRDYEAMEKACIDIDYVFHLAALKHVPICEDQPDEAIKTNILGTQNLIKAAINNNVKKVIDVSTDKAVDAINLYGMTKAVGEKLIIQANLLGKTRFICIRGGNVLGSNGSVVHVFINMIKKLNQINITDPNMTRYFITLPEAIKLLFKASEKSIGGETFVMQMPSFKITDLGDILVEKHGNKETKKNVVGIRPGEKIDEVLISKHESPRTYKYEHNYYLILPMIKIPNLIEYYTSLNLEKITFEEYSSRTHLLDKAALEECLRKGGFIN